ncbi:MAG: efflux RND transporter periplasmic adaptor subunit [Rhodanobacter sp.]
MKCCSLTPRLGALAVLGLLAGCSGGAGDANNTGTASTVAVTTVMPKRQTFHDNVEAMGSAVGDPHRARTLSLAYGGQIVEVTVTAGQTVKRGQSLLSIRADPATRSAYQQAQAGLDLARGELQRTEKLAAGRLATQSQLASARRTLADAQAGLQAQQAIGGGAPTHAVQAPADGVVTALRVGLGDRVAANAPLLDFTPAHALVAQLGVQPESGEKLRAGMSVHLTSVYGPPEGFSGTLQMIGQSVDPQTHLLPARVELPANAGALLVAGAPVTAQIHATDFTAWAVPRDAVLNDSQGDYLFQVHGGRAKRVDLKLRSPDGDIVGVHGPVDPQAPIIVLGVYDLSDGDAIKAGASDVSSGSTPAATTSVATSAPPAVASTSR